MKFIKLLSTLLLIGITGCSVSSSSAPPKDEIDKGVNWALSAFINWNDQSRNLFDSYEISNQYTEKRNDGLAYIYDFKAQCHASLAFSTDNFGNQKRVWVQGAAPPFQGEAQGFTGSFTLIRKGNTWYRQETIR